MNFKPIFVNFLLLWLLYMIEKDIDLRHMEMSLSDLNKFEKVTIGKGSLNFPIIHEKILQFFFFN